MAGPPLVVNGAPLLCTLGASPSALVVIPLPVAPRGTGQQLAVVTDTRPLVNVPSFGMCLSPVNPAVQAATSAASGVFTPAPCVPATGTPWTPGAVAVRVNGVPAVPLTAKCQCQWQGIVTATAPGQLPVSGA
jgi:hypothetical protein